LVEPQFAKPSDTLGEAGASIWTAEQVGRIALGPGHVAPLIREADFARISPQLDVWDAWPLQDPGGRAIELGAGRTLWMALAAPRRSDPDERHGLARIHLFQRDAAGWHHLGPALPRDFSPGSREWSGCAVADDDGCALTLYFTATGERGEPELTFKQRLFSARATILRDDAVLGLAEWRDLAEVVEREPRWYMASDAGTGRVGTIKAFRDPAYFRDPRTAKHYLLFAASSAASSSAFNGVVGAAVSGGPRSERWRILPPLLSADGLNNELERPHVVRHRDLYYLFWSTQSHVFDPEGPIGPTGLYGMVSDRIDGGWQPLNNSGLVFANPPEAAAQAYSWLVLGDLSVISFVDNWGQKPAAMPRRFGGSFAPTLRLRLDGAEAALEL